jgi:hypothetical protein
MTDHEPYTPIQSRLGLGLPDFRERCSELTKNGHFGLWG